MVVGVVVAMPLEHRAFVRAGGLQAGRQQVRASLMGVGMARAAAATEAMLAAGDVERIVVVGIAGRVDSTLAIGDVVIPEEVVDGITGAEYPTSPMGEVAARGRLVTFDDLQTDPAVLADLQQQGFAAVDMETAAVAAVCDRLGVPCTVFRAISDDGFVDAAVAAMARPDGSPDVGAAVRYLVRRPWRSPQLVALGRDAQRAARAAAAAGVAALTFGCDA
jgi:adenosylhomocysteine nucleosidase